LFWKYPARECKISVNKITPPPVNVFAGGTSPKISQTEALALGAHEFISAIQEDRDPLTSGKDGLDVVRILEASDKSIKNNGEIVTNSPTWSFKTQVEAE